MAKEERQDLERRLPKAGQRQIQVLTQPLDSPSPQCHPRLPPGDTLIIRSNWRERSPHRQWRPSRPTAGIPAAQQQPGWVLCPSQTTGYSPGAGCRCTSTCRRFSRTRVCAHPGPGGEWRRSPIMLSLQPDPFSMKPASGLAGELLCGPPLPELYP